MSGRRKSEKTNGLDSPTVRCEIYTRKSSEEGLESITNLEFTANPSRDRRIPNYKVRLGLEAIYVAQGEST